MACITLHLIFTVYVLVSSCFRGDFVLSNIGILVLFLYMLESWTYAYNVGIVILSFQTLEL